MNDPSMQSLGGALAALCLVAACAGPAPPAQAVAYAPRVREITVTTVPLLVKEAKGVYPFLTPAFAKGGVLDGKEVYGFSPGTLTVVEGDTIHFTFINPEDDLHSFVLPDLVVALPGNKNHAGDLCRSSCRHLHLHVQHSVALADDVGAARRSFARVGGEIDGRRWDYGW